MNKNKLFQLKGVLSSKIAILAVSLLVVFGLSFSLVGNANAEIEPEGITNNVCAGVSGSAPPIGANATTQDCDESSEDAGQKIANFVKTVLNLLTWTAGVAAVIVLIMAGIIYIVRGGSDKVAQARKMIIYALIGIVIVITSQLIVRFVIETSETANNPTTTTTTTTDTDNQQPSIPTQTQDQTQTQTQTQGQTQTTN